MYPNYQLQNSFNPYQGNAMGQQFSRPYQPYAPPVQSRPSPSPIEVYQVSNVEEAKAQIANPVAPTMFCNFGQGEVYVKHIDNNGQGQFLVFRMVNEQPKKRRIEGLPESELLMVNHKIHGYFEEHPDILEIDMAL